ncbi:MAG: hypothetical protein KIT27_01680, partial [Legionellales bacterium]|nr:hypothetical protein [Legionellales bacterium]
MNFLSKQKFFFLVVFILSLTACGGVSVKSATPIINQQFSQLETYWDNNNFDEFMKTVNQTHFIENTDEHMAMLKKLRRKLGKIKLSGQVIITDKPEDKRAHLVAASVMTTERGLLRFTLAYNDKLEVIGYYVYSPSLKF